MLRKIGGCTIAVEAHSSPSVDTVTGLQISAAVLNVLAFCAPYGGLQAIGMLGVYPIALLRDKPLRSKSKTSSLKGQTENLMVRVGHPSTYGPGTSGNIETTPVDPTDTSGEVSNVDQQVADTATSTSTRKRKCREYETGYNDRGCVDTCDKGEALRLADVLYGLRRVVEFTVFSCEGFMAGIVEVGGGS
ncbi:MAG: hypothetical protein M1812_005039 [Candelaria pacifica]|nr:MAG: hypothetical protein M1812_005039 [Candelaria pacifica]